MGDINLVFLKKDINRLNLKAFQLEIRNHKTDTSRQQVKEKINLIHLVRLRMNNPLLIILLVQFISIPPEMSGYLPTYFPAYHTAW